MAEYTPTDDEVREDFAYPWEGFKQDRPGRLAAFDRWLTAHDARVRRDAAREALDGLAARHRESAQDAETPTPIRRGIAVMADEAQRYRDSHYPEETP